MHLVGVSTSNFESSTLIAALLALRTTPEKSKKKNLCVLTAGLVSRVKRSPADNMYSVGLTWSRDAWAVSITAIQVSRARFSTIAQTFVEDVISLFREAVVAPAEFAVDLWPDEGELGTRNL